MSAVVAEFRRLSTEKGLQAGLKFLNRRAPHRFTGVFRFDPPELCNVALADAWNESNLLDSAPLEETFCGLVRTTGDAFLTGDGKVDPRLNGHVLAQNAVRSYCGVMLLDGEGQPIGTLCHFDSQPCDISVQELDVLHAAAGSLREDGLLW